MRKYVVCLPIFLFAATISNAQTAEDSVKQVISNLFKAAFEADSLAVVSCFWDQAIIQSPNVTNIKNESPNSLASTFGKLRKGQLDERIEFGFIHIDRYLASVWTPYRLYIDGKFIHCGVDSFQLIRRNGVWKISHLIDTRRKDCD
ncbi:MAG: hypothetical protein ACK4V4_04030 [Sphingobacteriales bacterium]|jgi:hypothetical protein